MAIEDYQEKLLNKAHSAEWLESFDDWTKIGALEAQPTFENYLVTSTNLSAQLAWNEKSGILAGDELENTKKGDLRTSLSELIKEFCRRRSLTPKFFIMTNIVEDGDDAGVKKEDRKHNGTWQKLSLMKTDGLLLPSDPGYQMIIEERIGKLACRIGDVKAFYATELEKAHGKVEEKYEGPTLIFIYTDLPKKNIKKGGFIMNDKTARGV